MLCWIVVEVVQWRWATPSLLLPLPLPLLLPLLLLWLLLLPLLLFLPASSLGDRLFLLLLPLPLLLLWLLLWLLLLLLPLLLFLPSGLFLLRLPLMESRRQPQRRCCWRSRGSVFSSWNSSYSS